MCKQQGWCKRNQEPSQGPMKRHDGQCDPSGHVSCPEQQELHRKAEEFRENNSICCSLLLQSMLERFGAETEHGAGARIWL